MADCALKDIQLIINSSVSVLFWTARLSRLALSSERTDFYVIQWIQNRKFEQLDPFPRLYQAIAVSRNPTLAWKKRKIKAAT